MDLDLMHGNLFAVAVLVFVLAYELYRPNPARPRAVFGRLCAAVVAWALVYALYFDVVLDWVKSRGGSVGQWSVFASVSVVHLALFAMVAGDMSLLALKVSDRPASGAPDAAYWPERVLGWASDPLRLRVARRSRRWVVLEVLLVAGGSAAVVGMVALAGGVEGLRWTDEWATRLLGGALIAIAIAGARFHEKLLASAPVRGSGSALLVGRLDCVTALGLLSALVLLAYGASTLLFYDDRNQFLPQVVALVGKLGLVGVIITSPWSNTRRLFA